MADASLNASAPSVWLVAGIPGAGKTTVAGALAREFARGVHIEVEQLQEWIVSGSVWPGDEPKTEADRQYKLQSRNAALLATSYAAEGFTVTIDHVISRTRVSEYQVRLGNLPVHLVVLNPGRATVAARDRTRPKSLRYAEDFGITIADRWGYLEDGMQTELSGLGFWIDTAALTVDQTVAAILAVPERSLLASP